MSNKEKAWDLVGKLYWNAGYQGGPGERDIKTYLAGVKGGTRVAVIGASTRFLVGAALSRGASVTVLDFSQQMCSDLREVVDSTSCEVMLHDITLPIPKRLHGKYHVVLADRLINRFTSRDIIPALREMLRLTRDDGEIRTSIRIGLYDRDLPLIEEGRRRGTLGHFFDEETWHIDYSRAGDILDDHLPAHGEIPRDVLLNFYRWRGSEKRLRSGEFESFGKRVCDGSRSLRIASALSLADTPSDTLYRLQPALCNGSSTHGQVKETG